MFSTFNKLKQKSTESTEAERNQASIEVAPQKSEEDIIKENIKKFVDKLDDVAWDLHDNSSFHSTHHYTSKGEKKREAASEAYGNGQYLSPILQIDTTTFGKGDHGMMFDQDGLYLGGFDFQRFYSYKELIGSKFKTSGGSFFINGREFEFYASGTMKKLEPVVRLLNTYLTLS